MFTNTGCKRLVDYYFVVSCSDRGKESTKKRLSNQSLAVTPHDKDARHALFALKPKIVDRYPTRNYGDTPLHQWHAASEHVHVHQHHGISHLRDGTSMDPNCTV